MSGRFTFTAGNTLTASQLNTNVMDGIPYKIVAGTAANVTGSLAVTFPASFTSGVTPVVVVTAQAATNVITSATTGTPTNTGFTIYTWTGTTASTTARNVAWYAVQMTSTTGPGNS